MAAAASRGAAVGGSNPSGDGGGPRLRSLPGLGNKPTALADITNTGKPNASRSITAADVLKENVRLSHLLREKLRVIELSKVEMHKLHLVLQASRQQNQQLAQANSQMLAELNAGKDRIKALQHELSCTAAALKVKASEIERKNKTANQRRKEVNSKDVLKAKPSKFTAAESHRIDGSIISGVVESHSAVPSNADCQESPQHAMKKRNKRKSESSERVKDTNIVQDNYKPNLQPILSLHHEDPRKLQRRRSSRLNQGSCEINEVSDKTFLEDTTVPSAPSSVHKQLGPTIGKDMGNSVQNECYPVVEVVMASEFEETEIDEQPPKENDLKEIQAACSSVAAIEPHQIGDKVHNAKQNHLLESQASVQANIIEPHKPPEDTIIKRGSNEQKLGLCERDSDIEDVNAKCDSSTSGKLHHEKKTSQRRKSSRLNPAPSEVMKSTFETLQEDVSMEQRADLKQNEACSSMKSTEGHVQGRRSMRRAAEKVVSYKEVPLNVKMRRP